MENGVATCDILNVSIVVDSGVEHYRFLNLLAPSQFFFIFQFVEQFLERVSLFLLFLVGHKLNNQSITLDFAYAGLDIAEFDSEHHSVGTIGVFADNGNLNFELGLSVFHL